jgi:hypothetical protein
MPNSGNSNIWRSETRVSWRAMESPGLLPSLLIRLFALSLPVLAWGQAWAWSRSAGRHRKPRPNRAALRQSYRPLLHWRVSADVPNGSLVLEQEIGAAA